MSTPPDLLTPHGSTPTGVFAAAAGYPSGLERVVESTKDGFDGRGAGGVLRIAEGVTLILGDCLAHLPIEADAVISDPPYGMKWDGRIKCGKNGHGAGAARRKRISILGDDSPFDPAPWLNYPAVVLFGSNHYSRRLPVGTTLVWIKKLDPAFNNGWLSDAELAWMKGGVGVYCKRDTSHMAEANEREHPSQKPVTIMAWVMRKAKVPEGATVLDPYMGSGTTGIACIRTGRKFIGIERDPAHFKTAELRIRRELEECVFELPKGRDGGESQQALELEPRQTDNNTPNNPCKE